MDELLRSSWFWWALALALFAAEALLPGTFMLWLGFAAAGVAVIVLVVELPLWGQWVVFSLLSLLSVWLGWRWRGRHPDEAPTDQPLLNRRAQQYIGRVVQLEGAIVNGNGRAHVGDTLWSVVGPDLPSGSRVRIVDAQGPRLVVEPAE